MCLTSPMNEYKVYSATVLPELPKGYFWRVKADYELRCARVQLRKKLLIGSSLVGEGLVHDRVWYGGPAVTSNRIYVKADELLSSWNKNTLTYNTLRGFVGDYPTKSL